MTAKLDYGFPPKRLYWLKPGNLWAARRKLRRDASIEWRKFYERPDPVRSRPFEDLLAPTGAASRRPFRFAVLADTGEGSNSQYALLPWLRSLDLSFLIINGDVAYPAGRAKDFEEGLFEPYRELGIPIWATPGNHEYYSKDKGQTFYQLFCWPALGNSWRGIPHVPQPGSYWELRSRELPVVVLAIDTGMKGNLDGKGWGRSEDSEQLQWLERRLRSAGAQNKSAIVLFHFPTLVRGKPVKKVYCRRLLSIVAQSPAVRLILCGHVHNLQVYDPKTFASYLAKELNQPRNPADLHYLVAGGGGAYLTHPPKPSTGYQARYFPDATQWKEYAGGAQKAIHGMGLGASILGRLASLAKTGAALDADAGRFMSFVLVEMDGAGARATTVEMDDLKKVIVGPKGPKGVLVRDPRTGIAQQEVDRVLAELRTNGIVIHP